jgi:uncharacterized delta-60 repeat protein
MYPMPETVQALAVQPDGKVVAAGALRHIGEHATDVMAVRFNSDGSRDAPFFAATLELTNDYAPAPASAALALQPDGKVVIAGRSWNDTSGSFVLGRYNADGTPDASFGASSRVVTPVARPESAGAKGGAEGGYTGLLVQPDGQIVVAGKVGYFEVALLRYTAAGALDTGFGAGGSAIARTTYVGGADLMYRPLTGGVDLAVVGSGAASGFALHDTDATNDHSADGLTTWYGSFNASGSVGANWQSQRPSSGSGYVELAGAVQIQADGSLLTGGVYYPVAPVGDGGGIASSQTADALVSHVVPSADLVVLNGMGGDGWNYSQTPSTPSIDTAFGTPPVIITVPAPVFSSKATVTRGRFYKFNVGYQSADAPASTPIGVYGPAGLVGAAKLVKVRKVKAKTPVVNPIVVSASYRIAAPGGRFDAGDNGLYAVRVGTATAPPLGQQLGQFTVASNAKARPAPLRRLILPTNVAAQAGSLELVKRKKLAPPGRGTSRASDVTSSRAAAAL